jgi:hypothetical protein|tara:strand:+ start:455 stop:883 length:429 start_codon:yes stop_codon:yes gene_type:complete
MNLENLQDLWKTDSKINPDDYGNESIKVPQLHMRYMEFYNTFSLMKKDRESEMRSLIREKWVFYKGKAPAKIYKDTPFDFKLTTKEEINMFIEADDDVRKLQLKIDYIDQVVFFLDGILRQINGRSYQIKNAIEWERFQSGM